MNKQLDELKLAVKSTSSDYVDPEKIDKIRAQIKKLKKDLAKCQNEMEENEATQDTIHKTLEKYESIKDKFPIDNIKRQYESLLNLEKTINAMRFRLEKETTKRDNFQKSATTLGDSGCPVNHPTSCKFVVMALNEQKQISEQEELIRSLSEEFETINENLEGLRSLGLKNKLNRYEKMLADESRAKIKLSRLEGELNTLESHVSRWTEKLSELEAKLTKYLAKSETSNSDEIQKVLSRIKDFESERDNKNFEFQKLSEEIGNSRRNIDQLKEEQKKYDDLQTEWNVYDFLIKAMSYRGVPTYIMSRQLPAINAELNSILQDISGFTVEVEVDERNTDVYINYGDSRRPIECASGMEKMVSSMALRVALSNVSSLNRSDMFIVDEGFGALDPQNIEAVTTLLHSLKKFYRLIMIISHVDVVKDAVDNVVEITKTGKNSKVRYE